MRVVPAAEALPRPGALPRPDAPGRVEDASPVDLSEAAALVGTRYAQSSSHSDHTSSADHEATVVLSRQIEHISEMLDRNEISQEQFNRTAAAVASSAHTSATAGADETQLLPSNVVGMR